MGQSQDDSIVGMKQSKQIPPPLPVSGNLSSSNPDLLQSHHRILDFNNQPGGFTLRNTCTLLFFSYFTLRDAKTFIKEESIIYIHIYIYK